MMQNMDYESHALMNIYKTLTVNKEITSKLSSLNFAIHEMEYLIPQNITLRKEKIKDAGIKFSGEDNHFFILLEKIIKALNNFGVMTQNSQLLDSISANKNIHQKANEKELIQKAKVILEIAQQFLFALEAYGIKHFMLAELTLEINIREKLIHENEEKLKSKTRYVLNKIDALVESLRNNYPEFYDEYQKSRRILTAANNIEKYENLSTW